MTVCSFDSHVTPGPSDPHIPSRIKYAPPPVVHKLWHLIIFNSKLHCLTPEGYLLQLPCWNCVEHNLGFRMCSWWKVHVVCCEGGGGVTPWPVTLYRKCTHVPRRRDGDYDQNVICEIRLRITLIHCTYYLYIAESQVCAVTFSDLLGFWTLCTTRRLQRSKHRTTHWV